MMNWIRVDTMSWIMALAVVVIAGGVLLHGQSSQIAPETALAYLRNGALVIDVRTPAEFSAGHLPNAMNIPLQQIESGSPLPLKDKNAKCQGDEIIEWHGVRQCLQSWLLQQSGADCCRKVSRFH